MNLVKFNIGPRFFASNWGFWGQPIKQSHSDFC